MGRMTKWVLILLAATTGIGVAILDDLGRAFQRNTDRSGAKLIESARHPFERIEGCLSYDRTGTCVSVQIGR